MSRRIIFSGRVRAAVFIIAALLLGAGYFGINSYADSYQPPETTYQTSPLAFTATPDIPLAGVANFVNKERVKAGLSVLTRNAELDSSALAKCEDMVTKDYWSHNDPSGREPWHFITDAGYDYRKAGENLAYGFATSRATVNGWMNSPTHKANILNGEYVDVGYGECAYPSTSKQGAQTLIVQHFGRK